MLNLGCFASCCVYEIRMRMRMVVRPKHVAAKLDKIVKKLLKYSCVDGDSSTWFLWLLLVLLISPFSNQPTYQLHRGPYGFWRCSTRKTQNASRRIRVMQEITYRIGVLQAKISHWWKNCATFSLIILATRRTCRDLVSTIKKLGVPSKLQYLTLRDRRTVLSGVDEGIGSWHRWFPQPPATPLFRISQPETDKVAHVRYWLAQIGLGCTGASRWNRKDPCMSTGRLRSQCGSFSEVHQLHSFVFTNLWFLLCSVLHGIIGPVVSSFQQFCLLG
jgi:hypothetical protein